MSRKPSGSCTTGRAGSGLGGGWLSVDGCDPVDPVDNTELNDGGDGEWPSVSPGFCGEFIDHELDEE